MNVLAIASSTETLSVAVSAKGRVFARADVEKRRHSAVLLDLVDAVLDDAGLAPAQLAALAVDVGPGAFTGVRTAIAAVQGLALAWGKRIIPVSSLSAMRFGALAAEQPARAGVALCLLDARMGEVYHALVDEHGQVLGQAQVGPPESLHVHSNRNICVALTHLDAPLLAAARAALPLTSLWMPAAPAAQGVLAALSVSPPSLTHGVAAHELAPMYVRNQVAMTIAQRQELGHAA